jgi:hypothetical protein
MSVRYGGAMNSVGTLYIRALKSGDIAVDDCATFVGIGGEGRGEKAASNA